MLSRLGFGSIFMSLKCCWLQQPLSVSTTSQMESLSHIRWYLKYYSFWKMFMCSFTNYMHVDTQHMVLITNIFLKRMPDECFCIVSVLSDITFPLMFLAVPLIRILPFDFFVRLGIDKLNFLRQHLWIPGKLVQSASD